MAKKSLNQIGLRAAAAVTSAALIASLSPAALAASWNSAEASGVNDTGSTWTSADVSNSTPSAPAPTATVSAPASRPSSNVSNPSPSYSNSSPSYSDSSPSYSPPARTYTPPPRPVYTPPPAPQITVPQYTPPRIEFPRVNNWTPPAPAPALAPKPKPKPTTWTPNNVPPEFEGTYIYGDDLVKSTGYTGHVQGVSGQEWYVPSTNEVVNYVNSEAQRVTDQVNAATGQQFSAPQLPSPSSVGAPDYFLPPFYGERGQPDAQPQPITPDTPAGFPDNLGGVTPGPETAEV